MMEGHYPQSDSLSQHFLQERYLLPLLMRSSWIEDILGISKLEVSLAVDAKGDQRL